MFLDSCSKIFYDTETDLDEKIFHTVLKEFLEATDLDCKFENNMTFIQKVKTIQNNLMRNLEYEYINLLSEILTKYGYNMKYEIKDAIFDLSNLEKPSKNKSAIKSILTSPIIQDVSFDGKRKFIISSSKYGDFTFELASHYFKRNKKISTYIRKNELPGYCHQHAYFLAKVFPDFYAITSLCSYYFKDIYYHSYTYDTYNNSIIDLCYNSIMSKEKYYSLFEAKDISVILNKDIDEELLIAERNTNQPKARYELLKIALYKQYLEKIESEQKTKNLKL